MLGYLANTLIFILVGVVISQRAFLQVSEMDWMYVVPMYIAIMVIRYIHYVYKYVKVILSN